ncbi:hypothetical protein [Paenibacillus alba]|uniref:Uncharacterized protein n=1 Tax=Paenibacillus alba TaxID=1197127 RepID=A0ABU6GAT3_9BACL|nr:hypothetical protein [Paenibacillus alba]MEC0231308.1 hypothetical protein [Paenibacillus alba]
MSLSGAIAWLEVIRRDLNGTNVESKKAAIDLAIQSLARSHGKSEVIDIKPIIFLGDGTA